jgi:hypothetical protein
VAVSEVSICNSALVKVGAQRIIALTDSNERARLCSEQYVKNRDELLRSHPWNFALKRVALSPLDPVPLFDWDNQFALPIDCLRVLRTDLGDDEGGAWKVEGRYLMANTDTISIQYIAKITDPTKFDSVFTETLACKIAADISYSLVQNVALSQKLEATYESKLRMARSFDAQEGQGDRVYADSWLNSRN